ncbi:hypothetical protein MLD38_024289 [Melastoma candidum]|nr:hypothetical protein MLD38_024289 [Melastoma candidum]
MNNNTFKEYAKDGATFAEYDNKSGSRSIDPKSTDVTKRGWIEPGKFFRESMLKEGNMMPFPDIRDRMPKRPFLPRSIVSKLPFSSQEMDEMKRLFRAENGSVTARWIEAAVKECEREPSAGETKRCVGSGEDMIDFATSVLGKNAVVRTTEGVNGSRTEVMIGKVVGVDGGRVTRSVSCHQSLYPYLMYYCHSVPKVRVYEADILDGKGQGGARINRGVAICHLDTSAWSASHGAFLALGEGPGRIEVCHWIFENDMTWTVADEDV